MDETVETSTDMTQPIIVDLGAQKTGRIKDLKKGQGKLWEEVLSVVDEVKAMLGEDADAKIILPVVMIYQKKPKRKFLNPSIFPAFRRMR